MKKRKLKAGDVCWASNRKRLVTLLKKKRRAGPDDKGSPDRWFVADWETKAEDFLWESVGDLQGPLNEMEIIAWSAK
jgi:hypothetical protein